METKWIVEIDLYGTRGETDFIVTEEQLGMFIVLMTDNGFKVGKVRKL